MTVEGSALSKKSVSLLPRLKEQKRVWKDCELTDGKPHETLSSLHGVAAAFTSSSNYGYLHKTHKNTNKQRHG